MTQKHQNGRNSRIWPERKTELDGSELNTQCDSCGLQWLIDSSLAGYRLRCECGAWVGAPSLPEGPALQGNQGAKRLEYWFDDRSPGEAEYRNVAEVIATAPARSRGQRKPVVEKRIDRGALELIALLGILCLPAFGLPHLVESSGMPWLTLFSSSVTGLLILAVCRRKALPELKTLQRPKWQHLAEANLVSYGAAAGIIALTPQVATGSMLGAGLAPALGAGGLWGGLLGIALLPALLEEYAFRGVLQGRMTQLFGSASGILMSSAAFALAHGSTLFLPAYLLLGLYLGWLRKRSQSLTAPILMHFLFNALLLMGQHFGWELPT